LSNLSRIPRANKPTNIYGIKKTLLVANRTTTIITIIAPIVFKKTLPYNIYQYPDVLIW